MSNQIPAAPAQNARGKQDTELTAADQRTVFLDAPSPRERWADVLARDGASVEGICRAMKGIIFSGLPGLLVTALARFAYSRYRKNSRGLYLDESDLFADASGGQLSRAQMAFVQRQYTWAHAGCTTASFWDPERQEMACMRCLDWPESDHIASATRHYRFQDAKGNVLFTATGLTGMAGILTGMRPGAYSIALNYAPAHMSADFKPDPTFLIRKLLENREVTDFSRAFETVRGWQVGAPCFISLCGVGRGEAAVVEFGPRPGAVHTRLPNADALLVQTNHFDAAKKKPSAYGTDDAAFCADLMDTSRHRRALVEAELPAAIGPGGAAMEASVFALWRKVPVLNNETAHVALMRPKSGTTRTWKMMTTGPAC